jgi:membrane protein YdbS with pleckstrin-like domain
MFFWHKVDVSIVKLLEKKQIQRQIRLFWDLLDARELTGTLITPFLALYTCFHVKNVQKWCFLPFRFMTTILCLLITLLWVLRLCYKQRQWLGNRF